ncbi:MAG TPA: L-histidine N(alpha)-methyltransferase [Candidatus Angelobacter sp.]|jgi:L-histidine N-alpha-methyltransferase|nr:L-histidine N(alpha)-methyltransferase [Candidatus Angelobacter sp.]
MTLGLAPLTLAVHTVGRSARSELIADVRTGLAATPKWLPPRWFYDERGSQLFDRITELPEYYQTRTETQILHDCAAAIAAAVQPESLVELGAGSCSKTRILLDAAHAQGTLTTFVPFDVSDAALSHAAHGLLDDYPWLRVYGLVGDFAAHLSYIPRLGRRLVAFLGSTIGNLDGSERRRFLADVRGLLAPGDAFLIGLDLVKDREELHAAYDDSAGVTADFNRNVLRVINRELDAGFEVDAFEHVALWNDAESRIEMHLRATRDMEVDIPLAQMRVRFAEDESVRTEISCKFTRESGEAMLADAAMRVVQWHTDPDQRFALALALPD